MTTIFLYVAVALTVSTQKPESSKEEDLINLIDRLRIEIGNFECEYEGDHSVINPQQNNKELHLRDNFTGKWISRTDRACMNDIYHKMAPSDVLSREVVILLKGETRLFVNPGDRPREGQGRVTRTNSGDYFRTGTPAQVLIIDYLIALLHERDRKLEFRGSEALGDSSCQVVDLIMGFKAGSPRENKYTFRFWIDLDRLGHPRRVEELNWEGRVELRLEIGEFHDFAVGDKKISMPVTSTFEGFITYNPKSRTTGLSSDPTSRIFVKLLPSTFKFPGDLTDKAFNVRHVDGITVSDEVRGVKYEYSHRKQPPQRSEKRSRADYERELQEALRIADEQNDELRASSWSRSGGDQFWQAISYLLIVASAGGFAVSLVIRRSHR